MNNDRKLLKQALNLLESEWPEGDEIAQPVIDAIREALAEPDIEEMTLTQIASRHEPVTQEPVAWRYNSNGDWIYKDRKVWDAAEPLYAAPVQPVKQEPFGYYFMDDPKVFNLPGSGFHVGKEPPPDCLYATPLYAAPVDMPQAEPTSVDAKSIRAEALEEAAKVAETFEPIERCSYVTYASDAIRGLK